GILLSSLLSFLTIYLINIGSIPSWSWRILFFAAIFGMLLGIWMRLSIPESVGFILENASTEIIKKSKILSDSFRFIKTYSLHCTSIFFISWLCVCVTFSAFIYSPIHTNIVNNISQHDSLTINIISLILLVFCIPIFGILSDHISRLNMLITSSICLT